MIKTVKNRIAKIISLICNPPNSSFLRREYHTKVVKINPRIIQGTKDKATSIDIARSPYFAFRTFLIIFSNLEPRGLSYGLLKDIELKYFLFNSSLNNVFSSGVKLLKGSCIAG